MQGETILCIGTVAWGWLWRPVQQIISRMANQNRVLYFEPGRDPDKAMITEFLRNLPNFVTLRSQKLHDNLTLISTPSSIPHGRNRLPAALARLTLAPVNKINSMILIRQIRWAARAMDISAPILWLNGPYQMDLIGEFGEKLVCYLNADEHADYIQNANIKDLVRRYEDELTRRADVVFATSRAQWENRKAINPKSYLTPNGVDFELFSRALDPALPLPADLTALPRPMIGYAGWLGGQIDVDLLNKVAKVYPNCSLVLVGPDDLPKNGIEKELHSRHNVFFLGRKELRELPEYLKAFDVALIPYTLAGYPLTAYPLKLHEYLAAGRAVVATAMPELRPFQDIVYVSEGRDDFVNKISGALKDHSQQAIAARIAVARENTWDQRVTDIYRILDRHLSNSHG